MAELVSVRWFETRPEAEIARSVLEAAGIVSVVEADDCGGWHPPLLVGTGGARLLVEAGTAPDALRILDECYEARGYEQAGEADVAPGDGAGEESPRTVSEGEGHVPPGGVGTRGFRFLVFALWFAAPALVCLVLIIIRGCR